jgi:hypothetical protein
MSKPMQTSTKKIALSHQERLQKLQLRCQFQREQIIKEGNRLKPALAYLDVSGQAIHTLRRYPVAITATVAGLVAGVVLIKPQRALGMLNTGLRLWNWWQRFAPIFNQVQANFAEKNSHQAE